MKSAKPVVLAAALILIGMAGLSMLRAGDDKEAKEKEEKTIGEITVVDGTRPMVVEGVGLVVGLRGTGSDPLPGPDRAALVQEMQKWEVSGAEKILASKSTALVRLRAVISPGARGCKSAGCWCKSEARVKAHAADQAHRPHKGDTLDVEVQVPSKELTTSLEGGWLLRAWLQETASFKGGGVLAGRVWAFAAGPVMVDSALGGEEDSPEALRRGRILGGGVAMLDRNFLLLTDNAHRQARYTRAIMMRINERFHGGLGESAPVADTKNALQVTLKIPTQYRHNIRRFLDVVGRIPIYRSDAGEAEQITRYQTELMNPVTSRTAALRLEGIGVRSISALKDGMASEDPDVRFFSAEALAYLSDPGAAEELADAARDIPEYRAHALTALSSLDEAISRVKLRQLLDDGAGAELKYGAFRALRALDDRDDAIPEDVLGDHLHLHRVATTGVPVIHVSSRDRCEIVLFGRELALQRPLHLKVGSNILLQASTQSKQIQLSRFEKGEDTYQEFCGFKIDEVIRRLTAQGATYPDVVSMLIQADQNHNLPGRFEMDALPDPARLAQRLRRLYADAANVNENEAMPNLFHWFEAKKGKAGGAADETSDAASDDAKPKNYLTKPSTLDRIFKRSAN